MNHISAKSSHYNKESKFYDEFNEKNSALINATLEKILRKYKTKSILDLTCGTGSQVFWLTKHGYKIIGADINSNMLKIAKNKAKKEKLDIKFLKGDMRSLRVGEFNAVLTIFNAIGHLTQKDFEKALKNIYKNLKKDGLYIFDIFNLNYLLKDNNISSLTIDWQKTVRKSKIREIQYSTINKQGILTSYTISYLLSKITKSSQTLQIYTAQQLKEILSKNGFRILTQCGIDGSKFSENKTDRILTIAKKS